MLSSAVQVELSSETDLFFHFLHAIEEKTYVRIQENQRLMVEVCSSNR